MLARIQRATLGAPKGRACPQDLFYLFSVYGRPYRCPQFQKKMTKGASTLGHY